MPVSFSIQNDHRAEIRAMLKEKVQEALWRCGEKAEGYAKINCRDMDAVDTGLLRNSITHALSGEGAKIADYEDDNKNKKGSYSGTTNNGGLDCVYIGTNVEYAQYVEFGQGSNRSKGARPFLRKAISDHAGEYRDIIHKTLGGKIT